MDYKEAMRSLLERCGGIFTTQAAELEGIPRSVLKDYVEEGLLNHLERGIYGRCGEEKDILYCIYLRTNNLVFSNETALYLHGLLKIKPEQIHVTVPRSYPVNRLRDSGLAVTTVKDSLFGLGTEKAPTSLGRLIPVYDRERTLCDTIKNRSRMDRTEYYRVLKQYAKSPEHDTRRLMEYAKKMGILKLVIESIEMFFI